jgi:hypothetical protein
MSGNGNKNGLPKWGDLFGDPNDQSLSNATRGECLSLLTQHELAAQILDPSNIDSPNKRQFLDRARMIQTLSHAPQEQRHRVQSMLCMEYLSSKRVVPASVACVGIPSRKSHLPSIPYGSLLKEAPIPGSIPGELTAVSNISPMPSEWLHKETAKRVSRSNLGLQGADPWIMSSTEEYTTRWGAVNSFGPMIRLTKSRTVVDGIIYEYSCSENSCPRLMRLRTSGSGWFDPVLLDTRFEHNHSVVSWLSYYEMLSTGKAKSKKQKTGLPPLLNALTYQLSLDTLGPVEIWRELSKTFCNDPIWSHSQTRETLRKQVLARIRYIRKQAPRQIQIEFTHDLIAFGVQHQLQLPPNHKPCVISSEVHLAQLAKIYEAQGYLKGKKSFPGAPPHRDLVVLKYDEHINQNKRYQQLLNKSNRSSKGRKESVLENTIVFTSLALLWNLCGAQELDWRVCGSADGTFNCCSNDFKLIGIGLFSINPDGTKRYHPLVYALAPGEIELVALIALECMKQAALEVFGLIPRFKGGLISDHTEVFTNAFHEAFPLDMLLQCFPHIIRKFRIDGEREGNGSYFKYLSGKNPTSWLHEVAENDVYMLRECRTDAMFGAMKKLVMKAWLEAGEIDLVSVFSGSYLEKQHFNRWYYCASGIPGCIPQNNSHERSNLDTKGCARFRGIIQQGRSMTKMLNVEFPQLIFVNSDERVGTSRHYPILDESRTLNHKLFGYYHSMDANVDIKEFNGGFLVNKEVALGTPIDDAKYEKAMSGEFNGDFKHRHEFFESVDDLCFVQKQKLSSHHPEFYCGSCFDFYNHLTCHHAAIFQYQAILPMAAKKLPTTRGAVQRRRARGNTRVDKIKRRRLERAMETNKEMQSEKEAIKPLRKIFDAHTQEGPLKPSVETTANVLAPMPMGISVGSNTVQNSDYHNANAPASISTCLSAPAPITQYTQEE